MRLKNDLHCIPFYELNLDYLIHEIPKPRTILQICARPALIRSQICRCGPNEIEDLEVVSDRQWRLRLSTHLGSAKDMIINRRTRKVYMPVLKTLMTTYKGLIK